MHVFSVNIGEARAIQYAKSGGITAIYKTPRHDPVFVSRLGLRGDAICDVENHGGPDQAVYVYGTTDYAWWSAVLGRPLAPGTFGENLTISDLESADRNIGDRLIIGSVVLEITAPRIPCRTLATRMGDSMFVKRFREAERLGLYCRVIVEGDVAARDAVTLEPFHGATLSAREVFRDFYAPQLSETALRRHLAAPIAIRDRIAREAQLAKLLATDPSRAPRVTGADA